MYALIPFQAIKALNAISNPVKSIRALVDLFLAKPFGAKSIAQRIASEYYSNVCFPFYSISRSFDHRIERETPQKGSVSVGISERRGNKGDKQQQSDSNDRKNRPN